MTSVRTYTIIYAILLVLGSAKFVFFEFDLFTYWMAMGGTIALAAVKSGLIAGYYMHLIEEPRAVTYMMVTALFMVLLLTIAAGYSIQ